MSTISSNSQDSNRQTLRPRARLLRTLGDELISNETVAIIELVKNAYDADATRVLVRFLPPLEKGKGAIEIIDNGHGMSLETVQNAWMEPATLMKKRQPRSEYGGRRVLGEKGIGRFASSRLANFLEVVTRRPQTDQEVRVFFDWSQFDDEQRYLDQIEVLWEQTKPSEIFPGGTIDVLWNNFFEDDLQDDGMIGPYQGTVLRMEQLRNDWDKTQLEDLATQLSRLSLPSFGDGSVQPDQFHIRLDCPPPFEHLSGVIASPQTLQHPHYNVRGTVDEIGRYDFTLRLKGQDTEEQRNGTFTFADNHEPRCGPFYIELRVWDRDPSDLELLAQQYLSTLREVRRDLNRVAGINIYRDGFRVLPYGEPRNDWLRLDIRRVQNPTLRLSNNQIFGYILISADANPELRDQSNREGIMDGPALDDLRSMVIMALALIEQPRYTIRRQTTPSEQKGGLFANFDLSSIRGQVRKRYPQDTELLNTVEATQTELDNRVAEIQKVLARYIRLSTLGQLIDAVLHDGRAPLAKIMNEAFLGIRDIDRSDVAKDGIIEKTRRRLDAIRNHSDLLSLIFRRIEPFGGRKRGKPARIALEQVVADAFAVLDSELLEVNVKASLPATSHEVTVDSAEIQEVIINLLQNSLYWLRKQAVDERQIAVSIRRRENEAIEIIFSDSGPGVEPDIREHIFEPYFSGKPDGVGLGLSIAGQIVADYYDGSLELVDNGPLPGATFRIILRRRV